ncbi:hypothetical protein CK203_062285 [Vitis vinifera]|uniref:Uncharacterized protein n=1 Tax=Vitis vinifera TaxID=29760 RepID=A0A438GD32_VITVI|nr:hypothetical protein CK203_062285 [Vitis vinifera]
MKFKKAPDGSWVRRAERQAGDRDRCILKAEEEAEIRLEGIHVEATFSEPMMTESSFTAGPSSQPSFTELPSQAPHAPDHAPWMMSLLR